MLNRVNKNYTLYICHGCYSWSRVLQAICPPADGWRPANRGGLGATRTSVTFILFFKGGLHSSRPKGGSCPVLYSDLLRAIGTPVP